MIRIENLSKTFIQGNNLIGNKKKIYAVSEISLNIAKGETLGLVGESGCGKSTLARCVANLIQPTNGSVYINKINILNLKKRKLRESRSNFQIVFQDPGESLNPRMKIYSILNEPLKLHTILDKEQREKRIIEVIESVGLKKEYLNRYPHEFSGGQKQRIGIGRAIVTKPKFLILDEPTSSLDVSIRGQILNLLKDLQKEYNLTYLLITHDLSVVKNTCDKVAVMYLGKIIEYGNIDFIFNNSLHPYTKALLSSVPTPENLIKNRIKLKGEIPSPLERPSGCVFRTRCPDPGVNCKGGNITMGLVEVKSDHWVDRCCII